MARARVTRFGPWIHVPIWPARLARVTAAKTEWEIDFGRKKIAGTRAGVQSPKKSGIRIAFLGIEIHMAREW